VRITEQVWPDGTVPEVSVFNWAYNHAEFIRESIDSILMQETTFPVEIIIHDDASTDGTTEIIREYEVRYPQLFRNIIQTENQWSQGKSVMEPMYTAPRGKFIALTHGDDYWTAPEKLESQVRIMTEEPGTIMCVHDATHDDAISVKVSSWPSSEITTRDLIYTTPFTTCTVMFRKELVPKICDRFSKVFGGDVPLVISATLHGTVRWLRRDMATYRVHGGGVFSSRTQAEKYALSLQRYTALEGILPAEFRNDCRRTAGVNAAKAYLEALKEGKTNLLPRIKDLFRESSKSATSLKSFGRHAFATASSANQVSCKEVFKVAQALRLLGANAFVAVTISFLAASEHLKQLGSNDAKRVTIPFRIMSSIFAVVGMAFLAAERFAKCS